MTEVTELYRVVETDNFGRDYPNEKFFLWPMSKRCAEEIAAGKNLYDGGANAPRYWKVVPENYQLAPGFEP